MQVLWYRVVNVAVNLPVTTYDKQEHNSWLIRAKTLQRQGGAANLRNLKLLGN